MSTHICVNIANYILGVGMLRYKKNILKELKDAGYSSYRLRQEKVLSEGTLQKMRSGNVGITLESLGVICDILQCQPGDLVEWVDD
jgi:putative transcriptional regulator